MSKTLEEILEGQKKPEEVVEKPVAETVVTEEVEIPAIVIETAKTEVESKVETTETPETKPVETEVVTDEAKTFFDVLNQKPLSETKVAEVVIPDEVKAQLEELALLKTKLNDPLHKAVELGANREELLAIAAELKTKDYSKMSYQDLLRMDIAASGLEGDDLESAFEAEMIDFQSLNPYKQSQYEVALKSKFKDVAPESATLKSLEEAYSLKETPEQLQKRINETINHEKGLISEIGNKVLNADLYGLKISKEDIDGVLSTYNPDSVIDYIDDKNNLDAAKLIHDRFVLKNLAKIISQAEERGAKKANKETVVTKVATKEGSVQTQVTSKTKEHYRALGYPESFIRNIKD